MPAGHFQKVIRWLESGDTFRVYKDACMPNNYMRIGFDLMNRFGIKHV